LLKKLLALRMIAVTPHEIMSFAAWLGLHADEIESSNMDSLVQ
jgi:F420-dependent methylenetetrahydromethanopterin dehydrogenase